jgi:hypothetical protein
MSTVKILVLTAVATIAIAGLVLAQTQTRPVGQTTTKAQDPTRGRFVDRNGDGVCDHFRDADNDGIPNCQDPDWKRPQDGTGYKHAFGRHGRGFHGGSAWSEGSFRNGRGSGRGSAVCDGTGPKGQGPRTRN